MASVAKYTLERHNFKTGDVIAYTSSDCLGAAICRVTESEISHVGMCLWLNGRLYSIESMLVNVRPDKSGKYRRGVSMCLFSQRVDGSENPVFVYRTRPIVNEEEMVKWLMKAETSEIPYDIRGALEAGVNKVGCLGWFFRPVLRTNLHALFCSELVTKALQRGGVVDFDIDPMVQTPGDVISFGCFIERIQIC